MLTNEEALEIIKQHKECYVVWATDKNQIVAVHPIPEEATIKDRSKALFSMKTDYEGPTKGRFLSAAKTTLQTLVDESRETDRISRRREIFNSWMHLTIDQRIDILVNADFPEPMDADQGSTHIVKRLYKIHGPELSAQHIARLREFAYSTDREREQLLAQQLLQCYLSVLSNDPDELKSFWQTRHSRNGGATWQAFTEAAGDLPTHDPEIIDQLVRVVEKPFFFGPRYEAMIALGKIGPPAGERAIAVIKSAIYDSTDRIVAVRNRVIERIRTAPEDWAVCPQCFHGYVSGIGDNIRSIRECSHCLGLGYVPNI